MLFIQLLCGDDYLMSKNNLKTEFVIRIYKRHKDTMFSLAYGILKDRQEAENMVQESIIAFDRMYDKLRKMDNQHLARYVHKTVKNKSLNNLKRLRKMIPVDFQKKEDIIEDIGYDISYELLEKEFFDEVVLFLRSKSELEAEAFMYRYYDDYDYKKIAVLMGIKESYARALVCRAMKRIAEFINKRRMYEQKNIK